MKSLAKTLLRAGVTRLPWGARDTLLRALVQQYGEKTLLAHLAAEVGIVGFMAAGRHGLIQSAASDGRILLEYAGTGSWAEHTVAAFRRFFADRGGVYLDIGANIGLTAIPVARNPQVRCIAFEPDPVNFANLTDNIRRNAEHGNVELHQVALFDRAGSLPLSLATDGNLGDHRVVTADAAPDRGRTIQVPAARLDDVLLDDMAPARFGPLAVKLDAQGAEPFIIAGGQEVLRQASLVVLEFSPMLIDRLGGDVAVVIDFLAGFEQFEIARDDHGEPPVTVEAGAIRGYLERAYQRGRSDDRDYLDVHATRAENAADWPVERGSYKAVPNRPARIF